jgi:hypothetical protein
MTEIDRTVALDELDRRHDEALVELGALNRQIELVLTALRPASPPPVEMPAFVDRPQKPQPQRRAQRYAQ